MCLSQPPAAALCVSTAQGARGCASSCSRWNWAFGDLTDSHREGLNTGRALHTLPLCGSRRACSCFNKSILFAFIFFFLVCVQICIFCDRRTLNKSVSFFLNTQSYISKSKSISREKVEKFSSENVITEYLTIKPFSL